MADIQETIRSPQITHFSWGKLEIDGRVYKDAKLYPGGVRAWDWNETGTHHSPGIQIGDVEDLLEAGAEIVILSKGVDEVLQTMPETLAYLAERGIETHHLQTERAIEKYNELAISGARVAALIHSTC